MNLMIVHYLIDLLQTYRTYLWSMVVQRNKQLYMQLIDLAKV